MKRTLRPLIYGSALFGMFILTSCHAQQRQVASNEVNLEQLKANALANFSKHIDEFNGYPDGPASDGPYNATNNKAFLTENAPLFLSSNGEINKVYNYRWWMISKHL